MENDKKKSPYPCRAYQVLEHKTHRGAYGVGVFSVIVFGVDGDMADTSLGIGGVHIKTPVAQLFSRRKAAMTRVREIMDRFPTDFPPPPSPRRAARIEASDDPVAAGAAEKGGD